jgi:glycosyltransferase involved in cell wall biosynthesis
MTLSNIPLISFIVPTYKRPDGLITTLNSIKVQMRDLSEVEIIVVNNSMDNASETETIINKMIGEGLPIRLFHQPLKGLSNARNLGIEVAKGYWLCFIDDDEEIDENYLEILLHTLPKANMNCAFGGPCFPIFDSQKPKWVKEEYFILSFGKEARELSPTEYLLGGNLIISKKFLDQIGLFSIDFGHGTKKNGYGEDTELMMRAVKQGGIQNYLPQLRILHHIPSSRLSIEWFIKQKKLSADSKAELYLKYYQLPNKWKDRCRVFMSYSKAAIVANLTIIVIFFSYPFRNRNQYPFYENFLIEKILPFRVRFWINRDLLRALIGVEN